MHVTSLEIENFKSFHRRSAFTFEPGFNLILGANNAGKSTVLQALGPLTEHPHFSKANAPTYGGRPTGAPQSQISAWVTFDDLRRWRPLGQYTWALPTELFAGSLDEVRSGEQLADATIWGSSICLSFARGAPNNVAWIELCRDKLAAARRYLDRAQDGPLIYVSENDDGGMTLGTEASQHGNAFAQLRHFADACTNSIYKFDASRRPALVAGLSAYPTLEPTAANLASCINWLSSKESTLHSRLCSLVSRVLPQIAWVQAPADQTGGGMVRMECLPYSPSEERGDLAIPLDQLGSGVGNVIAILYVVLTSRHPQVICIDEPNQFLHPRALRELLSILANEGRQHQYILSAHSADVIAGVDASTITMLTLREGVTTVQQTSGGNLRQFRVGLSELGIRATDLHSRDRVLWVEGQTEELVFPMLLNVFSPKHAAGTAVLRVQDTGEFERRGTDPVRVVNVYRRLTTSSALAPPMCAIVLDAEKRKLEDRTRIENERDSALKFLPRRMLECYVLHPQAITSILQDNGIEASVEAVEGAICRSFSVNAIGEVNLIEVDAAKCIQSVFVELSDAKVEFRKTTHVPDLVRWLLANDPQSLSELGAWLDGLLASMD